MRPGRRRKIAVGALACVAVLAGAAGALFGSLPGVDDAPTRVAQILRGHGGRLVTVVPRDRVARAIVAIEDERYFSHGAVDPIAVGRVVLTTLSAGGADPGGSTIAQQLAKTLYRRPETLIGRLQAIGLAYRLERSYSKRQILGMYLNAIYFGHGFYGIDQASRGYFGRRANALSWAQASLLAGLPQAPSALDPFRYPEAARARRRLVLMALASGGALPASAARRLSAAPLGLTEAQT